MDRKQQEELNKKLVDTMYKGTAEQAEELIAAGADVNAESNIKWKALHYAVWYLNTECMELLIETGADINIRNDEGETPLHLASYCGYTNCMKFLIERGADTDIKNNDGDTPLYVAVHKGHIECIKYLIGSGKNIDTKNEKGMTAAETLETEYPSLYVKYIDELRNIVRLMSEDKLQPAETGFEFEI